MAISLQLRPPTTKPPLRPFLKDLFAGRRRLLCGRRPVLPIISFSLHSHSNSASPSTSEPSHSHHFTSSVVGSSLISSSSHWNLTHRHVTLLSFVACVTAISATWLFCSAIPTLLAFKRAAESMEKLMDSTREELPDTMAAIRLSGMEINDLTTELSDLGQEITKGVRNSTRAVRVAEERVRGFTTMAPSVSLQAVASPKAEPVVARTARGLREGLVKGRTILQMFFALAHFSKFALNYITRSRKR